MMFEAPGHGLGGREQRVEVRVQADRHVGHGDLVQALGQPVDELPGRQADVGHLEAEPAPVLGDLRRRRPGGLVRLLVRAQDLHRERLGRLRQVPAVVLDRPAGRQERLAGRGPVVGDRRVRLRVEHRRARRDRPGRLGRGAGEDVVDDPGPLDAGQQGGPDGGVRRTPDATAAGSAGRRSGWRPGTSGAGCRARSASSAASAGVRPEAASSSPAR